METKNSKKINGNCVDLGMCWAGRAALTMFYFFFFFPIKAGDRSVWHSWKIQHWEERSKKIKHRELVFIVSPSLCIAGIGHGQCFFCVLQRPVPMSRTITNTFLDQQMVRITQRKNRFTLISFETLCRCSP